MFKLFLLALIPAVVLGQSSFNACTGYPAPDSVLIEDCPTQPCMLTRGTDAIMYMTFTPTTSIQALIPRVRATILGLTVPYDLPADQQAACNNLGDASCPLSAGQEITWNVVMPITEVYPPIGVNVEMSLMNEAGQIVACFDVDAIVRVAE